MTMADTVAVMNHGRIEQMGPPAQMYDLPKTAFVANFVGQSNLGHGRITGRDGDFFVADVHGSTVKIPAARSAVDSGDILFGVRPEKVHLARDSHDVIDRTRKVALGDDMKATVVDVSFIGVATQYLVQVASGATWSVYEQNLDVDPIDLKPGDPVWIEWDPAHAFAVAAEGAEIPAGPVLGDRVSMTRDTVS